MRGVCYILDQLCEVTPAEHLVGIPVFLVHVGREVRGQWTIRNTFCAIVFARGTSLVLLHIPNEILREVKEKHSRHSTRRRIGECCL